VTIDSSGMNSIIKYTFDSIGNLVEVEDNNVLTIYEYEAKKVHAPSRIVSEDEISINITNPTKSEDINSSIVNISWNTNGFFESNFFKYIIDSSTNNGINWSNVVSGLGYINSFNDTSTEKTFNLTINETKTFYLRIPKNVTVYNAEIKLEGLIE
jgi:hypothetical protein